MSCAWDRGVWRGWAGSWVIQLTKRAACRIHVVTAVAARDRNHIASAIAQAGCLHSQRQDLQETPMAVAVSTLQHLQTVICAVPQTRGQSTAGCTAVISLVRSRQSRRRYRVIASARRLTALFECPADRGGQAH